MGRRNSTGGKTVTVNVNQSVRVHIDEYVDVDLDQVLADCDDEDIERAARGRGLVRANFRHEHAQVVAA